MTLSVSPKSVSSWVARTFSKLRVSGVVCWTVWLVSMSSWDTSPLTSRRGYQAALADSRV